MTAEVDRTHKDETERNIKLKEAVIEASKSRGYKGSLSDSITNSDLQKALLRGYDNKRSRLYVISRKAHGAGVYRSYNEALVRSVKPGGTTPVTGSSLIGHDVLEAASAYYGSGPGLQKLITKLRDGRDHWFEHDDELLQQHDMVQQQRVVGTKQHESEQQQVIDDLLL